MPIGRAGRILSLRWAEDSHAPRILNRRVVAAKLGLALGLFDADLNPRLRFVLHRIDARDLVAVGPGTSANSPPHDAGRNAAGLIRPAQLEASGGAAAVALPAPWWLHTDRDVLATTELAAVD